MFQVLSYCTDLKPVIALIKGVLSLIQFAIPILLILLGTIDLGKAVISSDDKEVKASQSRLIKRVIYAVAIFFVATLVFAIMNIVASSGTDGNPNSWKACWKNA